MHHKVGNVLKAAISLWHSSPVPPAGFCTQPHRWRRNEVSCEPWSLRGDDWGNIFTVTPQTGFLHMAHNFKCRTKCAPCSSSLWQTARQVAFPHFLLRTLMTLSLVSTLLSVFSSHHSWLITPKVQTHKAENVWRAGQIKWKAITDICKVLKFDYCTFSV